MAGTISEKWGRRLSNTEAEFLYYLRDYDTAAAAKAALVAHVNAYFQGLILDDVEVEELEGHGDEFFGRVQYSEPTSSDSSKEERNLAEVGDYTISINTTGLTKHIDKAIERREGFSIDADGNSCHEEEWPIGSHESGEPPEGVDLVAPQLTLTYTRVMANAEIDAALVNNLYTLTGKINGHDVTIGDSFGFQAQEVLFMGARLTQRGNGDWELEENFAISPEEAAYDTGFDNDEGVALTIKKAGWDYVWWRMKLAPNPSPGMPDHECKACLADRVYHRADLRNLPGVGA